MFIGSEILAPDLVWQDLRDLLDQNYFQTLKAGGRERERETSACLRISCNLEKYHEWVLKSFSCASAFARQSRIFDGIDALYIALFLSHSQMFKLTKHSFLNS